jgi:hypothetical protein
MMIVEDPAFIIVSLLDDLTPTKGLAVEESFILSSADRRETPHGESIGRGLMAHRRRLLG